MAKQRRRGTGQIQALPSGRYRARIRYEGHLVGAPRPFETRAAADAWLKRAAREIAAGTFIPPASVRAASTAATLTDYSTRWLAQRDLRERTRIEYRGLLDRHITPALGSVRLTDLDPARVRAWHAGVAPGKARTRAAAYSLLRAIMTTAAEDGLIGENPCKIRGATSAPRSTTTALPTPEQLAALEEALPKRLRVVVPLAAWLGLRSGEIAGLQRGDLDLDNRVLHVRRAAQTLPGGRRLGDTKTAASRRSVAIPEPLVAVLQAHLDAHVGPGPEALLLTATRSDAPLPISTFRRHWEAAREEVGLPGLRLHDLRHFAGTMAARSGATVAETMARLGHTSSATAMRYQHAAHSRDREVADALADVIPIRRPA